MKGDIAVRSITASISLCTAFSAPRTICSVTGSQDTAGSSSKVDIGDKAPLGPGLWAYPTEVHTAGSTLTSSRFRAAMLAENSDLRGCKSDGRRPGPEGRFR